MTAMTNLLVKDDTPTTAIEWTLVPVTDTPVPFWRAAASGVPLDGQPRLTASVEQLKSGDYKITAKLEVPTMETLGASGTSAGYVAPPKVAYVTSAIFTMFCSSRSTTSDRYNAFRMAIGILQGATSTTNTGTLDQSDAAAAFAASTAPFPLLFGTLAVPN